MCSGGQGIEMNYQIASFRASSQRSAALATVLYCSICLSGCDSATWNPLVTSLQPLYTPVDLEFDSGLIGAWADEHHETRFVFAQEGEKAFKLTVTETDGDTQASGEFTVHLVRLGSDLFLDIHAKGPSGGSDFFQCHFLRAHTFTRVDIQDDTLRLSFFSAEWLKKRLEDQSVDTPHESVDGDPVLTGDAEELQRLVYRYAHDEEAFSVSIPLTREKGKEEE